MDTVGGKKSKANKTTATRNLHHPHTHLPMRYLTVVFLAPKTSAQPIIHSHYIFLNGSESFTKHALGTYSMCSTWRQREKVSPCPHGVCSLDERQRSEEIITLRVWAWQGHLWASPGFLASANMTSSLLSTYSVPSLCWVLCICSFT